MPSAPTDFQSFANLMGLQGEEIERLRAKALEPSQQRAQYAQQQLSAAERQARATGEGDISKTQSYGAYVAAAQAAAQQRAQDVQRYNENADSKLEGVRKLNNTANALHNDLRQQGINSAGVAKRYASQQEQQRARNAVYNEKNKASMADELALQQRARDVSEAERKKWAGYNDYRTAVNNDAQRKGGIGQSAAHDFDWSKYE